MDATRDRVATVSTRSIAIDRRERDTIDHAVGRSSIVVHRARPRSDRIESIRSRSRSIARSRSNERLNASERRRAYLGDDGGARGDAFLRARGSRRERDQSGVQRQGNHDCVCVTSRVESRMHVINVIHSFPRARARGSWRHRRTHTVWVRTHQKRQSPIRVHPVIHRTSSHPHPSRSRSRWWWWW